MDGQATSANRRNTRQKALILACLLENKNQHITADEICTLLKTKEQPVARATVYRFLSQLEKEGSIRKYLLSEGSPACYQYVEENSPCLEHFHLMCLSCGEIVHFQGEELEEAFLAMEKNNGFSIDGAKTVFYGKCPACAKKVEM